MEKLGFCLGWILACIFTLLITEVEYGCRNKSTFYIVAMLTGGIAAALLFTPWQGGIYGK